MYGREQRGKEAKQGQRAEGRGEKRSVFSFFLS
jgi:hypothetical protein